VLPSPGLDRCERQQRLSQLNFTVKMSLSTTLSKKYWNDKRYLLSLEIWLCLRGCKFKGRQHFSNGKVCSNLNIKLREIRFSPLRNREKKIIVGNNFLCWKSSFKRVWVDPGKHERDFGPLFRDGTGSSSAGTNATGNVLEIEWKWPDLRENEDDRRLVLRLG